MNSADSYSFIREFSEDDGVYLESACSIETIKELKAALPDTVKADFGGEYCDFLSNSNGAQIQNAVLYSSEEFLDKLENNIRFEVGHAGNMDAFMYNADTKKYEITNFFNNDEIFESLSH